MDFRIRTFTPIWTGDVKRESIKFRDTSIIGSLRWWFEAIVRGLGGYACDSVGEEKRKLDVEKYKKGNKPEELICPVCYVFGTTGWSKRFRLEIDGELNRLPFVIVKADERKGHRGWFLGTRESGGLMGTSEVKVYGDSWIKNVLALSLNVSCYWGVGATTILENTNSSIPKYSIYLQIYFTLKKPHFSKDDDEFYIIDNPIVKDKVFKLPVVKATTWKGALRFAAIKVFEDWIYEKLNESRIDKETVFKERARIAKLFGNEKDSQKDYLGRLCLLAIGGDLPTGEKLRKEIEKINKEFEKWLTDKKYVSKEVPSRSGRLFFYPTFFEEISLDVITPLSRETKTPVRGPIYFETVEGSKGTKSIFRLLYYPFDLIARGEFDEIEKEMKEDLKFLAKALKKMFYEIGFSAKKSSGFGVVEPINDNDVKVDGFKSDEVKDILLNTIHQS